MDTRSGSSTLRNEEIYGNTANANRTSTRRDSNDVPHSLDREHKYNFVPKKGRRTSSYLLRGYKGTFREKADTKPTKTELSSEWKLFTDRAASSNGSGAGLMLIDPEGKEYAYALRFEFETTNNKAEYEALLAGLRISEYLQKTKEALKDFESYTIEHIRRNQNKKADTLSKLASMTFEHLTKEVLVEVLLKRSIEEKEILHVETKEGENWMTPIHEYLVSGLLPEDLKESRKIKVKAPQYKLIRGNLYRRSFYTPWLCCVASPQTGDIIREVHKGTSRQREMQGAIRNKESSRKQHDNSRHGMDIQSLGNLYKGLKVTQSFSPITEHMEIMNHIEKQLARSQQGWVDDLAQVLWEHKMLLRNSQKETPFSLTYGSKTIIPISKNDVAKDDKGRINEVDKRRGSKEIASIEEAYYRRKLRSTQVWQGPHMVSKVQGRGLYKISDASDHSLTQTSKSTSLRKFYM
ncbi:reverse transcriptase domain-containing protein [Tanacetum coccineum]